MHEIAPFPKDFLLGAATSAHQVEGNNIHSDWWLLEHHPAMAGRLTPSGRAIDHFNRYEEDIALLAGLGYNAYRFSVEWARVEPVENEFSQSALDHYQRMIDCVLAHGMTPVVTLHHFTQPAWVALQGTAGLARLPDLFAVYCAKVVAALGDRIAWLCTINEANIKDVMGFVLPSFQNLIGADRTRFLPFALLDSYETVACAHKKARQAIKALFPRLPVGLTLAASPILPIDETAIVQAERISAQLLDRYLDLAKDDDFIGIQVYQRHIIDALGKQVPPGPMEETDSQGKRFDPTALGLALRKAWERTGRPLLITENGICTHDDQQRIRYIDATLESLRQCQQAGLDIRGYLHWSAFDNYEWGTFEHTFGLIAIEGPGMVRKPKPSAYHLGAYSNGM